MLCRGPSSPRSGSAAALARRSYSRHASLRRLNAPLGSANRLRSAPAAPQSQLCPLSFVVIKIIPFYIENWATYRVQTS